MRTIGLRLSDFWIIKSLFLNSVFKAEISSLFKLETGPFSLYYLMDKRAQSLILAFKKLVFSLGKSKSLMSRYKSSNGSK